MPGTYLPTSVANTYRALRFDDSVQPLLADVAEQEQQALAPKPVPAVELPSLEALSPWAQPAPPARDTYAQEAHFEQQQPSGFGEGAGLDPNLLPSLDSLTPWQPKQAAAGRELPQAAQPAPEVPLSQQARDTSATEGHYQQVARQAAQKYGLDPNIFQAQIQQESSFNPSAVSPVGARGIAQFMPATAAGLGVNPDNPEEALDGTAKLMRSHLDRYGGDYAKALAAYNAGPGAVDQAGGVPQFEETQRYVANILQRRTPRAVSPATGDGVATARVSQDLPDQAALSDPDKWALCGPVAAVAAAMRYGKDWTVAQAKQIAQEFNLWDPQNGMHGLQAQVELLNKGDIPATIGPADLATMAREVGSGNTVIISTPKHYFTATGFDPKTGKFNVGSSGTVLRGGSQQMTLDDITRLGGGIQGAAYIDNPESPVPSIAANPEQTVRTPGTQALNPLESFQQSVTGAFEGLGKTLNDVSTRGAQALNQGAEVLPEAVGKAFAPSERDRQINAGFQAEREQAPEALRPAYDVLGAVSAPVLAVNTALQNTGDVVSGIAGNLGVPGHEQIGGSLGPLEIGPREVLGAAVGMAVPGGESSRGAALGGKLASDVADEVVPAAITKLDRMFSEPVKKVVSELNPAETARRWFVRNFTDRQVDLNELQKSATKEIGRPLSADEMVSELSRLNANVAAKVRVDDGLRPALQTAGPDVPWLRNYLTAQNNVDVAAALNAPNRKFSGGLTAAESQDALDWMQANLPSETIQRVKAASQQIHSFVDDYRQRMLESGVWSQELYDALTIKHPNYIPTRIVDYMKDPVRVPVGKSLSLRDRGLRALTEEGTERTREDPLASLVRFAYDSEAIIQKNRAFNAFVNLREAAPSLAETIKEVPTTYTPKRGEKIVTGFVDGVRKTYVAPSPIAEAISSEATSAMPGFVTAATTLFRELITRFPAFVAGQVPLDAYSFLVRETARNGGPAAIPRVALKLVKSYGDAFGGLLSGEFRGDTARYLREGGGMMGLYNRSVEAGKRTVDDLARRNMLEIKSKGDLARLVRWVTTLEPVQAVGQRVELAPRVAAMRLAEQRGANPVQAVIAGRDVTLDFQRGGTLAKALNGVIPFFNVGFQSSAAVSRMLRENPTGFLASALTLVSAPVLAAEAWNRSDPDRARDYSDVPSYIRDRGLVFMIPGLKGTDAQGNPRPNYAFIPMRELAPIAILTRTAAEKVLGDDTRGWGEIIGASATAASPIQANNPADLFSSFLPVGANEALQLATNKDFFRDRDIATERNDQAASAASKGLAAALEAAGVRARPGQVEFAIRSLGGGAAQALLGASDIASGRDTGEERLQSAPLVGGIAKRYIGDATGQELEKARSEEQRIPQSVADVIRNVGFRPEEIVTPVGFTIRGVSLSREQQQTWQEWTNSLVELEVLRVANSGAWQSKRDQREKLLRDAVAHARELAANQVLKTIPTGEQEQLKLEQQTKKAG